MAVATTKAEIYDQMNNLDLDDLNAHYRLRDFIIQLSAFGDIGLGGDKYFLDPVNGDDTNDGLAPWNAFATMAVAYAALTDNANDILFIIGGATANTLTATLTWAKNYAHCVGLCSSVKEGNRVVIDASANFTPIVNITGTGCQFANLRFIHDQDAAGNLVNVSVAGSSNSFYNCEFEGPGHATIAGVAYREVSIAASAVHSTFVSCTFGLATSLAAVATGVEVEILGECFGTYFISCTFIGYSSHIGKVQVKADVNFGAEGNIVIFDDCNFLNMDNNVTQTQLINPPTTGNVLFKNCTAARIGAWATTLTNVLVAGSNIA